MQQPNSKISKLQSLCSDQIVDPKLFGLALYDFMTVFDKDSDFCRISKKILATAKKDVQLLNDLADATAYEMELAYYHYRDYQIQKYGKKYHSIFSNVLAFELYRDSRMAVISHPIMAKYRILRDFVWSLEQDNSSQAQSLLKKSAVLDEEGRVQECIFAPSFSLWDSEKKRLENIKKTFIWHSWDRLAYFYLNYGRTQYDLKEEDIPELRFHMHRILRYTITSFETRQCITQEREAYKISYNDEERKLKINNDSTIFKKNADSCIILKMLVPVSGRIKKRTLTFEAVSEKIRKNDHTKDDPNIYEICRSINKNLAKIGHPEFLLMPDDTVQINPKYLC